MGAIKSKMGTIGNKMGRKFEQKRKAKWVKKKENWSRPSYKHRAVFIIMSCMKTIWIE